MDNLILRKKFVPLSTLSIILGVLGALSDSNFWWLSTTFFGSISLILLFNINGFKKLLIPMKKPFIKNMIKLFLLYFLIRIVFSLITILFNSFTIYDTPENPVFDTLQNSALVTRIINLLQTSVSIIGEEFLVAGITLPIAIYLKKVKYNWFIANIIGCLAFGLMHIITYDFQFWVCFIVGISRYPFSQAWITTKSLRGGIYLHLISDLIVLLPKTFI